MYKSGIMLLYSVHLHYWNLAGPAPPPVILNNTQQSYPNRPKQASPNNHLGLKFHCQAYLVATLIEVLAINKGGEGEGDAIPHLLVAQTHLSRVVNLGPQSCIFVQSMLASPM